VILALLVTAALLAYGVVVIMLARGGYARVLRKPEPPLIRELRAMSEGFEEVARAMRLMIPAAQKVSREFQAFAAKWLDEDYGPHDPR
jgi:hypothetical protein